MEWRRRKDPTTVTNAFWTWCVGRAQTALKEGRPLFQIELIVNDREGIERHDEAAAIAADIEALGWRLDHAGFVPRQRFAHQGIAGQSVSPGVLVSETVGIYLFRAPD